ncbi:MAG: hypothetical protein KQJ78_04530 [Deltaproteobacteria bacterium]|nr:hypothetical protein [Deltaproteobacteria bacterium]
MARNSKWNENDRKKLLQMVEQGVTEQDIRSDLAQGGKDMTAVEFAQQFKTAMVEAGKIKQSSGGGKADSAPTVYEISPTGRLTITDFQELTGAQQGEKFVLEKPRGRSKAWRLVPA